MTNSETNTLPKKQLLFIKIGSVFVAFSCLIALVDAAILPLFGVRAGQFVHPAFPWIILILGCLSLWYGGKSAAIQKIKNWDRALSQYIVYKIVRWVVLTIYKIIAYIVTTIIYTWAGHVPDSDSKSVGNNRNRNTDDIWQQSPQHYYDKEPPPPFK